MWKRALAAIVLVLAGYVVAKRTQLNLPVVG